MKTIIEEYCDIYNVGSLFLMIGCVIVMAAKRVVK